jgi:hypothetical protein
MSAADAHSSAPGKPGAPAPEPSRRWTRSEFRQTFEAVRGRPVAVESLAVLGIGRTRPDLVLRELAGLSTAQTLDEVKDVVLKAHDALKMLGPYEAVEVTIDDSVTVRS